MAVQKHKKSRAKSAMRRSHHRATIAAYGTDAITGEVHRRHRITASGYYRGKAVVNIRVKERKEEEDEA